MYFTENSYISIMQIEIFSKVKAPRVFGKVKHELEDVLRIALIGVLCSCDDYDEISDLIEDNAEEFKSMGIPQIIQRSTLRGYHTPCCRGCQSGADACIFSYM